MGSGYDVSSSTTADGVDGSVVLVEETVTFKLLVEGEHGTLSLGLDVTSSTTATEEDLGGGRGNAGCWGRGAQEARAQAAVIASTSTAGMVVGTSVVDGRTFSDLDGHCGGFVCGDDFLRWDWQW